VDGAVAVVEAKAEGQPVANGNTKSAAANGNSCAAADKAEDATDEGEYGIQNDTPVITSF
jgi:hypothetical protein